MFVYPFSGFTSFSIFLVPLGGCSDFFWWCGCGVLTMRGRSFLSPRKNFLWTSALTACTDAPPQLQNLDSTLFTRNEYIREKKVTKKF
jgi:hypothetical protein